MTGKPEVEPIVTFLFADNSGVDGDKRVTRPFGELAVASNHNFGAIGDDLGHASADPASPANYNRNFSPSGNIALDS